MCRSLKMAVQVPEAAVELPQPMLWCCADVRTGLDVRELGVQTIGFDALRFSEGLCAQRAIEAELLLGPHCMR